jgi:hypothetical protein
LDPLTEIGGQLRRALGLDSYFDGAGLDARRITGGSPISALQPRAVGLYGNEEDDFLAAEPITETAIVASVSLTWSGNVRLGDGSRRASAVYQTARRDE